MPTVKQLLVTTSEQYASIEEKLDKLLAANVPPVVAPLPVVTPPVASPPPVVTVPSAPSNPGPVPWTRSRTAPVPKVVRTDLGRLVPPFNKQFIRGQQEGAGSYTWGKWPGTRYMPGTGDRKDLGLVNDDAARWLAGVGSDFDMLAWGEGHQEVPVHFRVDEGWNPDANGSIPVNVFKMPNASAYPNRDSKPFFALSGPITPEISHYPSAAYVPFLATMDLFYLQEVQDAATFAIISDLIGWGLEPSSLPEGQLRAVAWALNLLWQAYLATKEAEKRGALPEPLMPSSYWQQILDANRDRFTAQWVRNGVGSPLAAFGLVPITNGGDFAPWQQDMLGFVLGHMVWCGEGIGDPTLSSWRGNYEWAVKQAIDRTSGKSGYPKTQALQYAMKTDNVVDMASFAKRNSLTETADGKLFINNNLLSYGSYLRANLKMATLNNVAGASESFAWLDPQIPYVPARWAV